MIERASVGVGADMRVQQVGFAVFDEAVRVLEIGLALANRLHFCASERDAGFEFVQQKVIVAGRAVHGRVSLTGRHRLTRLRFLRGWCSGLTQLPGHTFGYESSC